MKKMMKRILNIKKKIGGILDHISSKVSKRCSLTEHSVKNSKFDAQITRLDERGIGLKRCLLACKS